MIRRVVIEGGWYGAALAGGEFAVSLRGRNLVETHTGAVIAPELIGTVCTAVPIFKIAGQDHDGPQNLEYTDDWKPVGVSYGVNACAYDPAGKLHQGRPELGSQGIRWIDRDGVLHTGDETYHDSNLNLFEYTTHGDLSIGQSPVSGCVAVSGTSRKLIEPGDCRFIKFDRDGSAIGLAIVQLADARTILLWFDRVDLANFPDALDILHFDRQPGPINNTKDTPLPTPTSPIAPSAPIADFSNLIKSLWDANPDGQRMLNEAADQELKFRTAFGTDDPHYLAAGQLLSNLKGTWTSLFAAALAEHDPRIGQRRKETGTHAVRQDGALISTDALMLSDSGQIIDVMSDRLWAWNIADTQPTEQWIAALKLDKQANPAKAPTEPPGAPQAPPVDLAPIQADIAALKAANAALGASLAALQARVGAIETKPPQQYTVSGKTSTTFGHQHSINLSVKAV